MSHFQGLIRPALAICVVAVVASCGGGGGAPSGTPAQVTVTTMQSTVSIDRAVPEAYASAVANITSPSNTGALGETLSVPTASGGGESAVLALDARNNILLASLATSSSTILTADSTALFLTRILIGALPPTLTPDQINAAIRATSEYSNLVALIEIGMRTRTAPSTSVSVFKSLNIVVSQTSTTILNKLSSVNRGQRTYMSSSRTQRESISSPSVATPLPFYLLQPTGSIYQSVFVTGGTALTQVDVANSMSIAWAVASTDKNKNVLCVGGVASSATNLDCSVLLPAASIKNQVIFGTTPTSALATFVATSVASNSDAFNITLEQTSTSHAANIIGVSSDIINIYIRLQTAGTASELLGACTNSLIDVLLPPDKLAVLITQFSTSAVSSYFKSLMSSPKGLYTAISKCASANGVILPVGNSNTDLAASTTFGAIAQFINNFGTSAAGLVLGSGNIGVELGLTLEYWNFPKTTFGVCRAPNIVGIPIITNCTRSFSFSPSTITMSPGSSATLELTAMDSSNAKTTIPSDIAYSLSSNAVGVISMDEKFRTVTALPGQTVKSQEITLTVTDESTDAKGVIVIVVASPVPTMALSTNPASLPASGGSVTLSAALGSPSGSSANTPPPTGSVTFQDSTGVLCRTTVEASGAASCSATISVAPDTIFSYYSGDSLYLPESVTLVLRENCLDTSVNWPPTGPLPAVRIKPCAVLTPGVPVLMSSLVDIYYGTAAAIVVELDDNGVIQGGGVPYVIAGLGNSWRACVLGAGYKFSICPASYPDWGTLTVGIPRSYSNSSISIPFEFNFEVPRDSKDYGERCDPFFANQIGGPYNCQHWEYLSSFPVSVRTP